MVKHYRDDSKMTGKHGVDSVQNGRKKSFESVVRQLNIPCSKRSPVSRGKAEKRCNVGSRSESYRPPEKKKKVAHYVNDSSSEDAYSSEESSDDFSDSSYTDNEGQSPPPSKDSKAVQQSTIGSSKDEQEDSEEYSESEYSEDEYTVERIVDMKRDQNGTRFFLIKWLNYESSSNTWEPIENLEKCKDLVDEFLKRRFSNSNKKGATKKQKPKPKPSAMPPLKECKVNLKEEPKNSIRRRENLESSKTEAQPVVNADPPGQSCSDQDSTEKLNMPDPVKPSMEIFVQIPNAGNIYYIRIIDDGQVNWIYIDMTEPTTEPDIYYKCIVTEDLTGKEPKCIFGATTDVTGEPFCLVQFEGYSYVDIIPPENLFLRFPSFRRYFELQCPNIFLPSVC